MKRIGISFDEMIKNVPKEEFESYYFYHSKPDTMKHFNVGSTVWKKYLEYYNIIKPEACKHTLRQETCLEKYGVDNVFKDVERIQAGYIKQNGSLENHYKKTSETAKRNAQKYGVNSMSQLPEVKEKRKQTCLQKYGVEYVTQSQEMKLKSSKTKQERYGDANYNNREKASQTCLERYGATSNWGSSDDKINGRGTQMKIWGHDNFNNRKKAVKTCIERYGEDYYIKQVKKMQSSISSHNNSNVNKHFAAYLTECFIKYENEFPIENFFYDFKIGNYLIEIDPYATHNSTWSIFGKAKSEDYHRNKTLTALKHGYTCIHVFDWTNVDIILNGVLNNSLRIVDTGKAVKHIFDIKSMSLTNKETDNTVIIYDDGFELIF